MCRHVCLTNTVALNATFHYQIFILAYIGDNDRHMKQYKKSYELKNAAKDKLDGKYSGAVLIVFLSALISWAVQLFIDTVAVTTINSVFATTGSAAAANTISFVFDALLLIANIILKVMDVGITLYFLNMACGLPFSTKDLFYGFKIDSRKTLIVTGAMVVCRAVTMQPSQYLFQYFQNTRENRWLFYSLTAMVIGLCIYIPVFLNIAMSFFLMLDFPQKSGKEILALCRHIMKGQRGRLLYLELSFLPLMLLCILSFGIGFLWLIPYMQMTYTFFFLDMMKPREI